MLDDVVGRAHDAGVGTMVTICTHLSRFDRVRAIAERYDNIWCSAGVHPHEADGEGEAATVEALVALAADPLVVGIGETGLDYYYEHSSRERQRSSFRNHIGNSCRGIRKRPFHGPYSLFQYIPLYG
jgi:TatD DNase family protein